MASIHEVAGVAVWWGLGPAATLPAPSERPCLSAAK